MIARLRGRIDAIEADAVVIDVGGVGYRVRVPASSLGSMGSAGDEVELHTHLYVREAEISLYGAVERETLQLFESLLTVSGIGPRLAMSVLSAMPPDALAACVERESVDELTRVPGVGRKTAQRIILDLKGKLALTGNGAWPQAVADDDALLALVGLGYSRQEAAQALAAVGDGGAVEDRLRAALQHLAAL
jgi:Holliday junction DNA helicase RuvA